MPRPFRLFREYDFFGILLPGLASVIFLYMLLPEEVDVSLPSGIIFVAVFGFVFGQALHSTSLFVESFPELFPKHRPSWSHRDQFEKELNNPRYMSQETMDRFRTEVSKACPGIEEKDEYTTEEAQTIYTFVRSYLHGKDHTRSSGIKAMYAFCRNMLVLLFGLIPVYFLYGNLNGTGGSDIFLTDVGYIDRAGKYTLYFENYLEFLKAVVPLALIGAAIFLVGTVIYQRFYVQYIVADFLAVRELDDANDVTYREL